MIFVVIMISVIVLIYFAYKWYTDNCDSEKAAPITNSAKETYLKYAKEL